MSILQAFEWAADPDGNPGTTDDVPCVVQNSWGTNGGLGYPDCFSYWWTAIDNCEAAGVVVTWSAGNEGPSSGTLRSPADRATTPYDSFSVGSTSAYPPFNISSFSSRGPAGPNCGPEELRIKPEIVAQGTAAVATYLDQAARLLGAELSEISTMIEAKEIPDAAKVGAVAASVMLRLDGARDYLFPPLVKVGSVKEAEEAADDSPGTGNVFGYVLIMTTVMALLFVATRTMGDLFEEKNNGMLRRMLSTPLDLGRVVLAKTVFGVAFGVIVLTILAVIGILLNWIEPDVDPLGVLLMGVTFSLAACGVLALVTSLVKNERQAGIVNWLVVMGMSALGGSMFPYENMPAPMQEIAHWTLNYWAVGGFLELVFENVGVEGVLTNLLVLAAMGLACNVLAHVLLVRRFRGLVS